MFNSHIIRRLRIYIAKRKNIFNSIVIKTKHNYKEYLAIQKKFNSLKNTNIFESEETLLKLSKFINKHFIDLNTNINGVCHGVRTGFENTFLEENIKNSSILGTDLRFDIDISNNDKMIIHDFNLPKSEWNNKFNFVYTNSLDHAYDPKKTISIWLSSLKKNGIIIICFTHAHTPASRGEPEFFSFTKNGITKFMIDNFNVNYLYDLKCDTPLKYKKDLLINKWSYLIFKKN